MRGTGLGEERRRWRWWRRKAGKREGRIKTEGEKVMGVFLSTRVIYIQLVPMHPSQFCLSEGQGSCGEGARREKKREIGGARGGEQVLGVR